VAEVSSYEAKTHLPRLLKRVERGERITITRHGVPVAELVPFRTRSTEDLDQVIREIKEFRKGKRLGRVTIRQLIEEGRKY
jgi:prevent-host-death family protein